MPSQVKCWICNEPANSAEHRLKKADIVRAYGKGPYVKETGPVHVRASTTTPIQGPGSSKFKYAQSLCHACNTTRTQPFDRAYDEFVSWLLANEDVILKRRFINFGEIYGECWPQRQLALFKYFVKSFGCRLVDAQHTVPHDLIGLLPLETFQTALKITFTVNEDVLLFFDTQTRQGYFGKGDLRCWYSKNDLSTVNGYDWCEYISWLTIGYWYGFEPDGEYGSTWIANSQFVYLGSVAPLPDEMRSDALSKKQHSTSA